MAAADVQSVRRDPAPDPLPTNHIRLRIEQAVEQELAALEELIASRYAPFRVLDRGAGAFEVQGPRGSSVVPPTHDHQAFIRALGCELNLAYAAGVISADRPQLIPRRDSAPSLPWAEEKARALHALYEAAKLALPIIREFPDCTGHVRLDSAVMALEALTGAIALAEVRS